MVNRWSDTMIEAELVLEIGNWLSGQKGVKKARMNSSPAGHFIYLVSECGDEFKITIERKDTKQL